MQKVKPARDKKYLAFIRSLPCLVCQRPGPSDPHHEQEKGHGTMAGKCSDYRTVPLCHTHHRERHDKGCTVDMDGAIERLNATWVARGGRMKG